VVVPAPTDPRAVRFAGVVLALVVTLTLTVLLRRTLDRYLAPDDPKRFYIGQAILYGGTLLVVGLALLFR
jgi:hypothetical protein